MHKKYIFITLPTLPLIESIECSVLSNTTKDAYMCEIISHKNDIECLELSSINGTSNKCKSNKYVGYPKQYFHKFNEYGFESRVRKVTNIEKI